MHYWHSLLILSGWLIVVTICGRAVARLLPQRSQRIALWYLSPALGLSLFVLVSTGLGWLWGTRSWLVPMVTALLVIGALNRERDWPQLIRQLIWICCAGAVISLGPLMTVWLYSGYNVYHDAFTYLVHAQWLQNHAFRETANLTTLQPAYTQVSLYQVAGLRMGASFFFGWVQAASALKWSIYVYPSVIAIALTVGTQAISGLTAALFPTRSRRLPLLWSLVTGTSISGFTFGCYAGFLPQTFGLAFGTALIALLVCFRQPNGSHRRACWIEPVPMAMLFAALGFAYSELLPFVALTLLGWFLIRWLMEKQGRIQLMAVAGCFAAWALLLLNFECYRIIHALLMQAKAVVGWPIPWSFADFGAHVLGLHAGVGDGDWWLAPPAVARIIAIAVLLILLGLVLFANWPNSRRFKRWSAPLVFVGISCAAFMLFRYAMPSPWPVGLGQSWSQFKLSNWISPVLLALLGVAFLFLNKTRLGAIAATLIMLAWLGANINAHHQLAPERIRETLRLTGRTNDPFAVYEKIRAAATAAQPAGTIFLELGGSDYKSRQIAAYFLHDFPVAADWTGDGYIYPRLPAGWESLSLATSRWMVSRRDADVKEWGSPDDQEALVFSAVPEFLVTRQQLTGGHGLETDASGWWAWSPDQVSVRLKILAHFPVRACLKFSCIAAAEPRELTIEAHSPTGPLIDKSITLPEGWQSYTSPPFALTDSTLDITIRSHAKPVPIGGADPRLVAFLVKNVRVELLSSTP